MRYSHVRKVIGISLIISLIFLYGSINLKEGTGIPSYGDKFLRKTETRRHFLAILCLERSGSTWLTDMFNQNEDVSIIAEPIGHLAAKSKAYANKVDAAQMEIDCLLNKLDNLIVNTSHALIGFNEKLLSHKFALPSQNIQMQFLASYMQERSFRVVVLIRKNLVQQALSMLRATQLASKCGDAGWSRVKQTGWEKLCGKFLKEIEFSDVPIADLIHNIEVVSRNTKELLQTAASLNLPHLTIYYEDLWKDTDQTMQLLSNWIGFRIRPTQTIFMKQSSLKLVDIPNIDLIRKSLMDYNSCYAHQLDHIDPLLSCLSISDIVKS